METQYISLAAILIALRVTMTQRARHDGTLDLFRPAAFGTDSPSKSKNGTWAAPSVQEHLDTLKTLAKTKRNELGAGR